MASNEQQTRKMYAGLSNEVQSAYQLKSSVEAVGSIWTAYLAGDDTKHQNVHILFQQATDAFLKAMDMEDSANGKKAMNPDALRTILSENILWSYIRLAIVSFSSSDVPTGTRMINKKEEEGSHLMVFTVVSACLTCMESYLAATADRIMEDLLEGSIRLFGYMTTKMLPPANQRDDNESETLTLLKFAGLLVSSLANAAKKYANRKKLFSTFCQRLLAPCILLLQRIGGVSGHIISRNGFIVDDHQHELISYRDKLSNRLQALMENCLFSDDKYLEDLSVVNVATESLSDDTIQQLMNTSTSLVAVLPQWMYQHLSIEETNSDSSGQNNDNQDQKGKSGSKKRKTSESIAATAAGAMTLKGLQTVISSANGTNGSGSSRDGNVLDSSASASATDTNLAGPRYKGTNECHVLNIYTFFFRPACCCCCCCCCCC